MIKRKVSRFFRRKRKQPPNGKPPQEWRKTVEKRAVKKVAPGGKMTYRKIRLPGLRHFKRGLAFLLLCINFIFGEYVLGSQNEGKLFFLLFLLNSFILADYLWKTRSKSE